MNFSDCDQKNNTSKTSAMTMPFLRNPARMRANWDSGSIPTVLAAAAGRDPEEESPGVFMLAGIVSGWERPIFLARISRL